MTDCSAKACQQETELFVLTVTLQHRRRRKRFSIVSSRPASRTLAAFARPQYRGRQPEVARRSARRQNTCSAASSMRAQHDRQRRSKATQSLVVVEIAGQNLELSVVVPQIAARRVVEKQFASRRRPDVGWRAARRGHGLCPRDSSSSGVGRQQPQLAPSSRKTAQYGISEVAESFGRSVLFTRQTVQTPPLPR